MIHNRRSRLGRVTLIAACLITVVLVRVLHASDQAYDVVISWRHERLFDEPEKLPNEQGAVAIPRVLYYWNDRYLGFDRQGLAEIYVQLIRFKGKSILFRNRPREKSTNLDDPMTGEVFQHFSKLLRKRDVVFAIEYRDDKRDVVLLPWKNPFRQPQAPAKENNKTEQIGGCDGEKPAS